MNTPLHTRLCIFLLLWTHSQTVSGQNCFFTWFENAPAQAGDTARIALRARDFEKISSYQFAVQWDPADLKYLQYDLSNSALDFQLFNANQATQGKLPTAWSDVNAVGVTLPDDAILFELVFKVLADTPGYIPVRINPIITPIYEVAQETDQGLRTLPFSHIWGGILNGVSGSPTVSSLCTTPSPCSAPLGAVDMEFSGDTSQYQFLWTGPNNFTSSGSDQGGLAAGYHTLQVTGDDGPVLSGTVYITANANPGVRVDSIAVKNAACGQANGCMELMDIQGVEPFSFQWQTPGNDTPSRCNLPPGNQSVTVTDALGCFVVKQVLVGNDTTLYLAIDSINADCRFGQKGGINLTPYGASPYQYTWSNGANTEDITGLSPGWYTVTVSDAAGCVRSGKTEVRDYGTFDWNLWLSKTCPSLLSAMPNSVRLNSSYLHDRAAFPLTLSWNTGTMQLVDEVDEETTYQQVGSIYGVPPGTYSVTVTDAEGCSELREILFDCFPAPPPIDDYGPSFKIDGQPNSSSNVDGCITVTGDEGISQLDDLRFSLKWPGNLMDFKELSIPYAFQDIAQDNFVVYNDHIDFHWQKSGTYSLQNTWALFKVCFESYGFSDNVWVEFASKTDEPANMHHQTYGDLGFIGKANRVYFEYSSNFQSFCDVNLSLPDCAADGYARIQLSGNSCSGPHPNNYQGITGKKNLENFTGGETMLFAEPGTYWVQQNPGPSESRLFAVVPPYDLPETECVWPGDADNNSVVNQYDLLYLGFGMGTSGTARSDTTPTWRGSESADWQMKTPLRQINFKNMDSDGDGAISAGDTLPIALNWGKVINLWKADYFALPGPVDSVNAQWSIGLPGADTLTTGIEVAIPVVVGTPETPVSDVLGLAFSISIDSSWLVTAPRFVSSNSWLGDATNLVYLQKYFPGQHRMDIALTRTNGTTGGGFGEIGKMLFALRQRPPGSLLPLTLFTSNGLVLTADETLIALNPGRSDFMVSNPVSTGLVADLPSQGISILPNPAREYLLIRSSAEPATRIEIYTAAGQFLKAMENTAGKTEWQIGIGDLPPTACFARVFTQNGIVVKKFVKAR